MVKQNNLKGISILSITAFIWGCAFVAQSAGMDFVGPFTFNAVRNFIGGLFLMPCIAFLDVINKRKPSLFGTAKTPKQRKMLLLGGTACGAILAVASALQQLGILNSTVGKAGFITTLYIIFVPLFGLVLKKHVGKNIWVGVVIAIVGLYLLCITSGFSLTAGDTYLILCAIVFAFHILTIDHFSPLTDGVRMACIQFFVAGVLNSIPMFLFEAPTIESIAAAWLPVLYTGVLSSGIAYTLQIIGQKYTQPTIASLVMSFESVVAVLAGWVLLSENMTPREILGCVLVFCAIIIAQLPERKKAA